MLFRVLVNMIIESYYQFYSGLCLFWLLVVLKAFSVLGVLMGGGFVLPGRRGVSS